MGVSLMGILLLVVLALLVAMIRFVVDGIREKSRKKAVLSVVIFGAMILLLFYGLMGFITSM